jgi:RNA polymerase sigma factor (sigma-70 family)
VKPLPDAGDLFERYHLPLFRYVWRMTGRRDVAEDLTQEVFVRVLRGIARYEARDREQAWLFRIARNLLVDHHRRHGSRQRADGDGHGVMREVQPGDAPQGPMQELAVHLDESLRQLDDLDREVFLLREVGGLSYIDISSVCDLTTDAVRSRICRARSKLRIAMGDRSITVRV